MKLGLPILLLTSLLSSVVFGFAIAGTFLVLWGYLPQEPPPPQIQTEVVTVEVVQVITQVVTATPAPVTPEATYTAQPIILATLMPEPTAPPALSAQMPTAQPTPKPTYAAPKPKVHSSGGLLIGGGSGCIGGH